jgi:hypothetical protein
MQRTSGILTYTNKCEFLLALMMLIFKLNSCGDKRSSAGSVAHFDINSFNVKADSLLTEIERKNIHFEVEKSVNDTNQNSITFFFNPGKGNMIARFNIHQDYYLDHEECREDFLELVKMGTEFGTDSDISGLTYTNDYVFRTHDHIYWINTPCYYADFNHEKLKRYFIESIGNVVIEDSLVCWCGSMCNYVRD